MKRRHDFLVQEDAGFRLLPSKDYMGYYTRYMQGIWDYHQCKLMGQSLPDIYTVIAKSYIKKAVLE